MRKGNSTNYFIPILLLGFAIGYVIKASIFKNYYNPRGSISGRDIIWTKDSIYHVHIIIDTAFEQGADLEIDKPAP